MNEIDLFPDDLRKQLLFARWLRMSGIAVALLSVVFVAAFGLLRGINDRIGEQIEYFQSQRDISNENRNRMERLNRQKRDLEQQLGLLSGLRGGASAEQMILMIDRSLPGPEVWLTNWKFRRAGTPVEGAEPAVDSGYFIVIPAGQPNRRQETWRIETNMTIQGQALDHVAMSKFVLNLTRQPEIENVRIVNSRQIKVKRIKVVDFSLEILVSATGGSD